MYAPVFSTAVFQMCKAMGRRLVSSIDSIVLRNVGPFATRKNVKSAMVRRSSNSFAKLALALNTFGARLSSRRFALPSLTKLSMNPSISMLISVSSVFFAHFSMFSVMFCVL